ncbi:MAG: hypothetical protein HY332_01125 [Chloroflexi bacterium]|nr:hypothetical protein [Chloroflexota bacterium]
MAERIPREQSQLDNRWPHVSVLVFSEDPWAVHSAVTEIERRGAQPTVLFDAPAATRALELRRPQIAIAHLGRGVEPDPQALEFLNRFRSHLAGPAPAAPLILLGNRELVNSLAGRLPYAGTWLQLVPDDDPQRFQAALDAALETAKRGSAAAPAAAATAGQRTTGRALSAAAVPAAIVTALLLGVTLLLGIATMAQRRAAPPSTPTAMVPTATVPATTMPAATALTATGPAATVPTATIPAATTPESAGGGELGRTDSADRTEAEPATPPPAMPPTPPPTPAVGMLPVTGSR